MNDESFCLYVFGRLRGLSRARLEDAVAQCGGRIVRKPSSRINLVAIGHSTARDRLRRGSPIALPDGIPPGAVMVSELNLKRALGLHPPHPEETRMMSGLDLARTSRLTPDEIDCLALYDVLEPIEDRFGYRDLLAAREVKRLLDAGLALGEIVEAAVVLRQSERGLSNTRLSKAPWGEIVQAVAGQLGMLDGQYTLPLDEEFRSVDEVFRQAEEAELEGDLSSAERLYRLALNLDRLDPVIPFNLGNVLDAAGRPDEAALAYKQAALRDASLAEAWLNLAALYEGWARFDEAISYYRRALGVRPDYADALFNLASLLTRREAYDAALPLWERYAALRPRPAEVGQALRMVMLCRMSREAATDQASVSAGIQTGTA